MTRPSTRSFGSKGGSLVVVQPVDGFEDFLTRLQALNPAIDLSSGDARPGLETPATEERGTPVNRSVARSSR
jgi:hypothetical protein